MKPEFLVWFNFGESKIKPFISFVMYIPKIELNICDLFGTKQTF